MNRILLVGAGPLAFDPGAASGPAFRTTSFFDALRAEGHEVAVAALADGTPDAPDQPVEWRKVAGGGVVADFSAGTMLEGGRLRSAALAFRPTAIVGVGSLLPGAAAAMLSDIAPVWVEFTGDPLAELQAKAFANPAEPDDTLAMHYWKLALRCLRRADRFSGVSRAQVHTIVGGLGVAGRLSRRTAGEEMAYAMPIAPHPALKAPIDGGPKIRGGMCPPGSFLCAWSGSYNTWVDDALLFEGLSRAMSACDKLHFVSTGGGSPSYNEATYERFAARVAASPMAGRFHLLGWIRRDEAECVHGQCDVGLNVDRWCLEAELGSRHRIVNFLAAGLPVASTVVAEVARDLNRAGGIVELPLADPEGMGTILAGLVTEEGKARLRESAQTGRAFVQSNYTPMRALASLLDWAANPRRAGDFEKETDREENSLRRMATG